MTDQKYEWYKHHGRNVFVRSDLKGTHREHCLCFSCQKFTPEDRKGNCAIANALYSLCVLTGITTPVFECPEFLEDEEEGEEGEIKWKTKKKAKKEK
jgi:hypothetical protein